MTIFGPDGSSYDTGLVVSEQDWAGTSFMRWRAVRKGNAVDTSFGTWMAAARAHNVPFVGYLFPRPVNMVPAAVQAETFRVATGGDTTIPVDFDWESDGSISITFDDVLVVKDALARIGYRTTLLYTGSGYWNAMGRPRLAGHGFDLIRAQYGNQSPTAKYEPVSRYLEMGGDTGPGWGALGGLTPVMWQFGSRIHWGNDYGDYNAMRGSPDLSKWFKMWTVTPPPPPPPSPPPGDVDDMTQEQLDQLVTRVADAVWVRMIGANNAASLLEWSATKAGQSAVIAQQTLDAVRQLPTT